MTELQRLRMVRSELRRQELEPLLRVMRQLGWLCPECGCEKADGYTLNCTSCWDRAYRASLRGHEQATRFLAVRRVEAEVGRGARTAARQRGRWNGPPGSNLGGSVVRPRVGGAF